MMDNDNIKEILIAGFPSSKVEILGDGRHFQALIISDDFVDKDMLQRHKMVYRVLGDAVGNEIHALSLKTCTYKEWDKSLP